MQGKLLYIGTPSTAVEPVIQVMNSDKVVITSIRLSAPTNNSGTFDMYHMNQGKTVISTTQALAFNLSVGSKTVAEFLTHPLPVSAGESIWVGASHVSVAIYGVTLP